MKTVRIGDWRGRSSIITARLRILAHAHGYRLRFGWHHDGTEAGIALHAIARGLHALEKLQRTGR